MKILPILLPVVSGGENFPLHGTVLVERLSSSSHRTGLGFRLFDAELCALFDGVIFKTDILQIFKIYLFF